MIIPIAFTILAFWGHLDHRILRPWTYPEGLFEIKFISIILAFMFAFSALFTVTMTLIQNRKRNRVVEQWSTFNPIDQKKRQQLLAQFMDDRFGSPKQRQTTRYYHVKPEQNLDTDAIRQLYETHHLDELDK